MARCKTCGKDTEVLLKVPLPAGERFLGMCKPCILKHFSDMRSGAIARVKLFMSGLFK